MQSKLIIVANRLPVSVTQTPQGLTYKPSPGGLAAALNPSLREKSTVWVGYAGINRKLDEAELAELGLPAQLRSINIEAARYKRYYYNVANGSVWPAFHDFKPRRLYDEGDWQAALAVTKQFAQKVVSVVGPKDRIWIHDYHLMMLPKTLRDMGVKNKIGFFLHTPFAEPKFFKLLPHHRDIFESLFAADLIGVQTRRDLQRFHRVLTELGGDESYMNHVGVFPVGIDYEAYRSANTMPEVRSQWLELEERLAAKTVIFSVSRLDYTKGIIEQLDAIEGLLEVTAQPQSIIYKLVVAPSREDLREYRELKDEISTRVKAINKRFKTTTWQPIDYEYRNMQFQELNAWYCRTNIMLVAPLIDGQNLIAKEYIASRPDDSGVLVLSEKAGAAMHLTEALLVDPSKPKKITAALQRALAMPLAERRARHKALRRIVKSENALYWAKSFNKALQGGL